MDIDVGQLPRYVNGGPMMVYAPETVGFPKTPRLLKKSDAKAIAANKARIAATIRQVANPSIAKRQIDASIVKHAAKNRATAEKLMRKLGITYSPKSATMSGLFDWLTGAGRLSSLDHYSTAQREQLKSFLKAESTDAIEKTFTQEELDQVLARIREGAKSPEDVPALSDPYRAASKEYQQAATKALAPMGSAAATAAANASRVVGEGIVERYRQDQGAPGRPFEWLGKAKWVIGAAVLFAGGYALWPRIKPYVSSGSVVAQKMNALRTMFGGLK